VDWEEEVHKMMWEGRKEEEEIMKEKGNENKKEQTKELYVHNI